MQLAFHAPSQKQNRTLVVVIIIFIVMRISLYTVKFMFYCENNVHASTNMAHADKRVSVTEESVVYTVPSEVNGEGIKEELVDLGMGDGAELKFVGVKEDGTDDGAMGTVVGLDEGIVEKGVNDGSGGKNVGSEEGVADGDEGALEGEKIEDVSAEGGMEGEDVGIEDGLVAKVGEEDGVATPHGWAPSK